jgi:phosphoribosyl 1,2-cyclic phosphate phosphodiesterase
VGVPRIACDCAVCRSDDPRNKRLRCSVLIENQGQQILVDTTPDLRTQALRHDIRRLDAILFTHGHADHLHGLDDVRCFCFARETPLPCYADQRTIARIEQVFDYAFRIDNPSAVPQLSLRRIDGPFVLCGLEIEPVRVYHGRLPVLGFRFGPFAYVTDCSAIPDASVEGLRDLDTLVLGALRHRLHPTHFNIEQALAAAEMLRPRRTFFTHVTHDLDHRTTSAQLPDRVELAYDGLVLEFG